MGCALFFLLLLCLLLLLALRLPPPPPRLLPPLLLLFRLWMLDEAVRPSRKKLFMAPVMGMPLLAYEARLKTLVRCMQVERRNLELLYCCNWPAQEFMTHRGWAPALR